MKASFIASVTDFGHADPFVGIMKAVALGISPTTAWIDLTHEVPPGDVRQAALAVWQCAPYLPSGTVLLAVVDPGVGSERRGIALAWDRLFAVGPDNGLFGYLVESHSPSAVVEIEPQRLGTGRAPSQTFHGRDVFAVAAARLASGWTIDRLGAPLTELEQISPPLLTVDPDHHTLTGEVIHIDRFGNAVTSLGTLRLEDDLLRLDPWLRQTSPATFPASRLQVALARRKIPLVRTFTDVAPGGALAYIGSSGLLEIGIHRGNAAQSLPLNLDDRVQLCYKG